MTDQAPPPSPFVWHELYVPDAEAAKTFYTEALGWTTQDMPMGEMGTYTMFVADGQPMCGLMGTADCEELKGVPPHWSTYVGVNDVDARLEACVSRGATVLVPPMDVPTVGRMAHLKDPQGATFWLFKGEKS